MRALNELAAHEALAHLSRREISAEELARACLERIATREPEVRAWEVVDGEGALAEARRIDGLADPPALRGLPIGVKDLIDTSELPTAYGSPIHRGHRPAKDAACVRALRSAGAVILGKTVTTEFAYFSPGPTRNPRDVRRTPGGSSSGSAAAVADTMVPGALGTQTAGSIIRPASFCGVVGFKPTFGVLPRDGIRPLAPSLDTLGVLTRAVADVPLWVAAISGTAVAPLSPPPRAPRFGLCRTELWSRAAPDTHVAIEGMGERLAREGAEVREVELGPEFRGLADAQSAIMAAEMADSFRFEREHRADRLSSKLREQIEQGVLVTPDRLAAARAQAERCRALFPAALAGCDVLITPSAIGEAPLGLESTGDPIFNRIWTLLHVPCLSLPAAVGASGLPIGVQLVARAGADASLLAVAAWTEERLGLARAETAR
jgi:Asp-tRNA(Asn)/Glu-tRNA(Gln) amidotransferase A subunit family amidase